MYEYEFYISFFHFTLIIEHERMDKWDNHLQRGGNHCSELDASIKNEEYVNVLSTTIRLLKK